MRAEIQIIYEKLINTISQLERVTTEIWQQNYYQTNILLTGEMAELEAIFSGALAQRDYFVGASCEVSENVILPILNSLLDSLAAKEYVLLADILQQSLLPFLYGLQEWIVGNELAEPECFVQGDRKYQVEYTSCGLPTVLVSVDGKAFYLHSNRNALSEARALAKSFYHPEKQEYVLFGMGLGYVAVALREMSEYARIRIFESDSAVLELAKRYGPYDRLQADAQIEIYADESGQEFIKAAGECPEDAICFFYPSIRLVRSQKLREQIEDLFVNWASVKGQYGELYNNFLRNSKMYDELADALRPEFAGKRVYLVAAGPSLDKNCESLRKAGKNGIVIAVGTVLKKLLKLGIRPDYVMVTDAKANTYRQVEGIEDAGIPLLGLSTVYYRFFRDYHAKHYLVCQKDFFLAEQFAKKEGCSLVPTGGSVMTTALSLVLELGVKEVVFAGLDLAFTDGKDHVSGTDYVAEHIEGEQRMIPDINGKLVPTGKNLDIYRKFIEKSIRAVSGVRFIDATEGGARIAGTELARLEDIVNEE